MRCVQLCPQPHLLGVLSNSPCAFCQMKRDGAKGVDAIPHLEMWKDLPFLVRDGVIFTVDTIKSKGRPNYESVL